LTNWHYKYVKFIRIADYDSIYGITSVIVYEYPFNERIRTYLRLEQMFLRLTELLARDTALDHHYALSTLFEIMDVGARADLKSDVLNNLEKQKQILNGFRDNPSIAQGVLNQVLVQIDSCFSRLHNLPGKVGHVLSENDWLMSIRSRIGIPGGTCAFDLPAYYSWQQESSENRRADLHRWYSTFAPLSDSIRMLLQLLRDSGVPQKVMANGGQFQQTLPQGRTFQLLRLTLTDHSKLIPEISGNRLMISIRLMQLENDDRLHPSNGDSSFELTLCS
jgi:cell division protein ZapD